jgi:hypothetical protein
MTWLPFRSIRLTGLVCFGLLIKRLQMRAHSGAFPLWTIGLLPTRALEQGLKIIWVWSVARLGVVSALFPRAPGVYRRLPCNFLFVITRSAPSVPFRRRSMCLRAFLFIGDRCTFHAFFWHLCSRFRGINDMRISGALSQLVDV